MIHFLPDPAQSEPLSPDGEMLERLAGLKRALRLVEPFGGGPAPDIENDVQAAAFSRAGDAVRRCFDRRSDRLVTAAAAGLETVVGSRAAGHAPNDAALAAIAQEIRAGLADLSSLLRR